MNGWWRSFPGHGKKKYSKLNLRKFGKISHPMTKIQHILQKNICPWKNLSKSSKK
jgi:hypothetical protein